MEADRRICGYPFTALSTIYRNTSSFTWSTQAFIESEKIEKQLEFCKKNDIDPLLLFFFFLEERNPLLL